MPYLKGLSKTTYWEQRYQQRRETAPGRGGLSLEEQLRALERRKVFVRPLLASVTGGPVLDYGCGCGLWANEFPDYTGVDISRTAIALAQQAHPDKQFYLWRELPADLAVDYVLTVAVLQHNSDSDVLDIVKMLAHRFPTLRGYVTYELQPPYPCYCKHIWVRSREEMASILRKVYDHVDIGVFGDYNSGDGELCGLTIFETGPRR